MTIALTGLFHNAVRKGQFDRYAAQVNALRAALPAATPLRLVYAWGDSDDGTDAALRATFAGWDLTLIERSHGHVYGSVDSADRWRRIAYVANATLDALTDDDTTLLHIESDLIWEPDVVLCLLRHLQRPEVDGCAAMCGYLPQGGRHYDTWGNRKDGVRFSEQPPYHPAITDPHGLTEVDSAGSAWAVRAAVARRARYGDEGIVSWCNGMRATGARLWIDLDAWVWHP